MHENRMLRTAFLALVACCSMSAQAVAESLRQFDIPPGDLATALDALARQAGVELMYSAAQVRGLQTAGLRGEFTAEAAAERLLAGTKLKLRIHESGALLISDNQARAGAATAPDAIQSAPRSTIRLAQGELAGQNARVEPVELEEVIPVARGIPEILVKGSRDVSFNTGIRRTEDDAQPYVVFDREEILRSGANTLDQFLKSKLSAAGTFSSPNQVSGGNNSSLISLRGLGPEQTLILVDGRRIASLNNRGVVQQPDINGIPLAAVERIEVLPSTASGIYGGGATGGVVNIVLRRDFSGLEAKATYENSFEGGGATRSVDLSTGFSLEQGRTRLMLTGSFSDGTDLKAADRDFLRRGREQILLNNPSSIMGSGVSPPVGATTNISSAPQLDFPCLLAAIAAGVPIVQAFADCTLAPNLTLKPEYGGTALSSPFTHVPVGYGGAAADNGAALVNNAGQYNLDNANTAQTRGGGLQSLISTPTIKSLMMSARREFTPWLDIYLDLAHSENEGQYLSSPASGTFTVPASSPVNPFQQDVVITTPVLGADQLGRMSNESDRATAGFLFQLPAQWRATVDYSWNRTKTEATLANAVLLPEADAAVAAGETAEGQSFDVFRDTNQTSLNFASYLGAATLATPARSRFSDVGLRFAGPIGVALPGGRPVITLQLEHRDEKYDVVELIDVSSTTRAVSRSQRVDSAYLEAVLPLVSEANRIRGLRSLELQLAGRRDEYSSVGGASLSLPPGGSPPDTPVQIRRDSSSTDPIASLRYQPVEDVTLRGSWGTGFLPPALNQLVPTAPVPFDAASRGLTDPLRGDEPLGQILVPLGGNPDLRPEESRSRSIGIVFTPRFVPGLRVSVDWTEIQKRDNVRFIVVNQATINDEHLLPGVITRGPASGGFDVGPITSISARPINVAQQDVAALDFVLEYRFETDRWGTFDFAAAATRNINNETRFTSSTPIVESVGSSAALEWKGSASIEWQKGNWTALWNASYFDAYCLFAECALNTLTDSQGGPGVPSQMYHDAALAYRFADSSPAILSGMEIRLGLKNVFDKEPPIDMLSEAFYSPFGDPRLRSYFVSLRKQFE